MIITTKMRRSENPTRISKLFGVAMFLIPSASLFVLMDNYHIYTLFFIKGGFSRDSSKLT